MQENLNGCPHSLFPNSLSIQSPFPSLLPWPQTILCPKRKSMQVGHVLYLPLYSLHIWTRQSARQVIAQRNNSCEGVPKYKQVPFNWHRLWQLLNTSHPPHPPYLYICLFILSYIANKVWHQKIKRNAMLNFKF